MDWNGHQLTIPFVPPQETSFNFLLHYNHHDQFSGMERKHVIETPNLTIPSSITDKKKRLNGDQVESLENSFQEEIKLDPDRKMKLAKELGLEPRQIAVWFQNRRARWKAKQLQNMYNALKQEFDVVCREKQKLRQEVAALRDILKGDPTKKQEVFGEISEAEETVDSNICLPGNSPTTRYQGTNSNNFQVGQGSCIFNALLPPPPPPQLLPVPPPPYWTCFPTCTPIIKDSDD